MCRVILREYITGKRVLYSVDISITDTVSVNAELFRSFRQKIEHNIFYHYIVNDLHVLYTCIEGT